MRGLLASPPARRQPAPELLSLPRLTLPTGVRCARCACCAGLGCCPRWMSCWTSQCCWEQGEQAHQPCFFLLRLRPLAAPPSAAPCLRPCCCRIAGCPLHLPAPLATQLARALHSPPRACPCAAAHASRGCARWPTPPWRSWWPAARLSSATSSWPRWSISSRGEWWALPGRAMLLLGSTAAATPHRAAHTSKAQPVCLRCAASAPAPAPATPPRATAAPLSLVA